MSPSAMSSRSCRLWSQATFQVAGSSSSHGFESGFHVLSFLAQFWVFACSPSPHPRTHLHSHTLIPMCTSTRSHNSHTHLYMLMHTLTCLYTLIYTQVHACAHMTSQQQLPRCSGPVRSIVGPSIKEIHIYPGAGGRERGLRCL